MDISIEGPQKAKGRIASWPLDRCQEESKPAHTIDAHSQVSVTLSILAKEPA